ncbi:25S rRNA (uracil(2843)-N(3))-methyltransferase [Purpureocillium takamizusanense]|uniref:25S rRNA (Uracil(2843)-N(3))-methyltransferase n=1 Tax=Purpureocillium takamizusanense TaxID=2060973 RepID=A0A9Q8Q8H3_9HYPO|nr:25S rRNA (uracil(2843)-N(3))-methyltransferase [Purpureocillium takamizusanense]UNI15819.1 25S rRNA (uracil(2843)-N(3))-methyltransferase [Purpureocillium takamizusanense]
MGGRSTASKRKPVAPAGDTGRQVAAADNPEADNKLRKHQQRLLNVFSDAFAAVLARDSLPTILQEIKRALYNRDFAVAFGRQDYLEAYAARWSPTRALCYAAVFRAIGDHLDALAVEAEVAASDDDVEATSSLPPRGAAAAADGEGEEGPRSSDSGDGEASPSAGRRRRRRRLRMLCFGGCAAEHVAFASHLCETGSRGDLTLVDSAPWSETASLLQRQLTSPPPLSKYASAAARAANAAANIVDAAQLRFAFCQADALSLGRDRLADLVGAQRRGNPTPLVVTLMFTLNELYTDGGIGKTTRFLRLLGEVLPGGSLLLVVDSPGSYSEAAVGKEKKKYPMQWLLNHTLLGTETAGYTWESIESEDSVWFRLPDGLDYPIQLENMRYQMHLYRIHRPES